MLFLGKFWVLSHHCTMTEKNGIRGSVLLLCFRQSLSRRVHHCDCNQSTSPFPSRSSGMSDENGYGRLVLLSSLSPPQPHLFLHRRSSRSRRMSDEPQIRALVLILGVSSPLLRLFPHSRSCARIFCSSCSRRRQSTIILA